MDSGMAFSGAARHASKADAATAAASEKVVARMAGLYVRTLGPSRRDGFERLAFDRSGRALLSSAGNLASGV